MTAGSPPVAGGLPRELHGLRELAGDLRWTWSHEADALWRQVDAAAWEATRNPWVVLQELTRARLAELADDPAFCSELERISVARKAYLAGGAGSAPGVSLGVRGVAYFSMEFGLGEGLPLYAGGLGILAGDVLKTASDLALPMVGIGLLYQSGYFRQLVDASGWQQETFPYNEPASLPIQPLEEDGSRLSLTLEFPGRTVRLRVWRARVGRVDLYLLDSNHPLNTPVDRGITGELYGGGSELRLAQEIVLGVGGWQLVERLGLDIDVCHINEGHAAFAILERARNFMRRKGVSFQEAFWATRAGNVFTTHTPVDAGFDRYSPQLMQQYLPHTQNILTETGLSADEALALGRACPENIAEPFNMAYLAMRGSLLTFGVSELHGGVSRRIFAPLFPRRPEREVPIGHVTNGVHVPTWGSSSADELWTDACGPGRWRCGPAALGNASAELVDERLWSLRARERADLVRYARQRLAAQIGARGGSPAEIAETESALSADTLTLGFARRFTGYKRPNLLLRNPERLARLLADPHRPVQLVIAGKAHPHDVEGKAMIREWVGFAARRDMRNRVVFLEDYDIALAQELVQGVDVWINTPRRPLEACGTSGMKVLVNGGLNISVLDGWWAEAYRPGVGWAVGDPAAGDAGSDEADAASLCMLIEEAVVPEFYDRDASGIPRRWVERIRRSMAELTAAFSSDRMMLDYLERAYRPAAECLRERTACGDDVARGLVDWGNRLLRHWDGIRIDQPHATLEGDEWSFVVPVYLGDLSPGDVRVELYAEPSGEKTAPVVVALERGEPIVGTTNGILYAGRVSASRPSFHYTARVVPAHPRAQLPLEMPLILWQQ